MLYVFTVVTTKPINKTYTRRKWKGNQNVSLEDIKKTQEDNNEENEGQK